MYPHNNLIGGRRDAARRRKRILLRFRRDPSGSAAVEFAIIAPVFFFLIFVIAETAMIFIAEQVMDNAVAATARLIRTGQVQQDGLGKDGFKAVVCGRMAVFIDCDDAFYLDVRSYAGFGEMDMDPPLNEDETFQDEGEYAFGGANDIVVMRAYYQWDTNPVFGGLSLQNLDNGKRLIGSFAAFRNEPYAQAAEAER